MFVPTNSASFRWRVLNAQFLGTYNGQNGGLILRSDGGGEAQKLAKGSNNPATGMTPWSFSPDGRRLAYFQRASDTGFDIWTLPVDLTDPDRPKAGKPEVFLRTAASRYSAPVGRGVGGR